MLSGGLFGKKAVDFLLHQSGDSVCKVLQFGGRHRFNVTYLVLGQGVMYLIKTKPLFFQNLNTLNDT